MRTVINHHVLGKCAGQGLAVSNFKKGLQRSVQRRWHIAARGKHARLPNYAAGEGTSWCRAHAEHHHRKPVHSLRQYSGRIYDHGPRWVRMRYSLTQKAHTLTITGCRSATMWSISTRSDCSVQRLPPCAVAYLAAPFRCGFFARRIKLFARGRLC